MAHWFRVYSNLIDDPKFVKLSQELRSALLMMWCVASGNDGRLPPIEDIAIKFRMPESRVKRLLDQLRQAEFIDDDERGSAPHNWNARQFKSDVSSNRVKQFRERQRNVSSTVSETPPDTEQNRAEQKQSAREAWVGLAEQIVKAFENVNSTILPDTSRAQMWMAQGYDPAICIAVIRDGLSRKNTIKSLNYFDEQIREAHEKRAPKKAEVTPIDWENWVKMFRESGVWPDALGPEPGLDGCRAPAEILRKHGYERAA